MKKKGFRIYNRMKKVGFDKVISDYPSIRLKKEDIAPYDFIRADDSKMIIRCGAAPVVYLICSIIGHVMILPMLYKLIFHSYSLIILVGIFIGLLGLLLPLYCLLVFIKKPDTCLIFDRKTQRITFKTFRFKAKTFGPYKVSEVVADSGLVGKNGATTIILAGKHGGVLQCDRLVAKCSKVIGRYIQAWSFVLWYLDKNRPLPPGEVFDQYRERDDERRKKAGYPKPIFPVSEEFKKEALEKGIPFMDNPPKKLRKRM